MPTGPTKRERKDEAKKRRLEEMRRRHRRARRRKLSTYAIVAAVIAAIVGAVVLTKSANTRAANRARKLAVAAGCLPPSGDQKIEGATHVPAGQKVQYLQDPPTSGNHWASGQPPAPAPTGILAQPIQDEQGVHNLEHGHVLVQYQPGALSAPILKGLEDLARSNGTTILLAPRQNRDAKLAMTAWGRSQHCPTPNAKVIDVVKDFHKRFSGQAPEKFPGTPVFQTGAPAASPTASPKATRRSTPSAKPTGNTFATTAPATPSG